MNHFQDQGLGMGVKLRWIFRELGSRVMIGSFGSQHVIWRTIGNTAIYLRILLDDCNILTSWTALSFSWRILVVAVSWVWEI